ncbi:MAG TPA: hypothetical protein VIW23_16095 [Candidatus Acidoferrum sp.]|jgi:hypothetical protein
MFNYTLLCLALLLFVPLPSAQDLDASDVVIPLDQALPVAINKAKADFPDVQNYILYSVHPRALKGDRERPKAGSLFWEFLWKEKAFPHYKELRVRVYMQDGSARSYRTELGTWQKEHPEPINP